MAAATPAPDTSGLPRVFRFNGATLADPDPHMTAAEVCQMYGASGYPQLTNASVDGPEVKDGKQVFTFRAAAGTKG